MTDKSEQSAPLLPVYLACGEDALKRATVAKRLRARLSSLGDLSFNSDEFDGEVASGADIVAACNTVPFASPVRLVEVRAADKLRKADAEAVVSYLDAPCSTTVLALSAEKLAKNTRLYKAVAKHGKTAVIDCAPLKRHELPRAVRSMAAGHGIVLTEGAAAKLVELAGEDTVRLDSELKKIALAHRGGDAVNESEVISLVSRTAEVKPWEFVDAFSRATFADACCIWGAWSRFRRMRSWPCARRACASWCAPAPWPTEATRAGWPPRSRRPIGA